LSQRFWENYLTTSFSKKFIFGYGLRVVLVCGMLDEGPAGGCWKCFTVAKLFVAGIGK
jgi:hypothetical protein